MGSQKKTIAVGLSIFVALAAWYAFWPENYGTVSESGYKLTMAVESACGRQDTDGVQRVRTMVQTNKSLSDQERVWLNEILAAAESGSWNDARRMARELMRAQLGSGNCDGSTDIRVQHGNGNHSS